MLGVYNYTVVLTYAAMLVSFGGIHFTLRGDYRLALLCLMLSGILDMFDGRVAATKKNRSRFERHFGIQIDSMSDLICFGVLPAIIMYCFAGGGHVLVTCICGAYLLCALIRLSYFNVDETERQETSDEHRHEYRGLPVTTMSLLLPTIYIICQLVHCSVGIYQGAAVMAAMGVAFITPFKVNKPALLGSIILVAIGLAEFCYLIVLR